MKGGGCSTIPNPQSIIIKTLTSMKGGGQKGGEETRRSEDKREEKEEEGNKGAGNPPPQEKQIKRAFIKHRCCKKNKLHTIWCLAKESDNWWKNHRLLLSPSFLPSPPPLGIRTVDRSISSPPPPTDPAGPLF